MLHDPEREHGQGADFLDVFLSMVGAPPRPPGRVNVMQEMVLPSCRLADVLLEAVGREPFAWLIENKLDAADEPTQFARYGEHLETRHPGR